MAGAHADRVRSRTWISDSHGRRRSFFEANKRRLGGQVELTTLPNAGHFSFLDNPEAAAEVVRTALSS